MLLQLVVVQHLLLHLLEALLVEVTLATVDMGVPLENYVIVGLLSRNGLYFELLSALFALL